VRVNPKQTQKQGFNTPRAFAERTTRLPSSLSLSLSEPRRYLRAAGPHQLSATPGDGDSRPAAVGGCVRGL
jgi:hypothetical protein